MQRIRTAATKEASFLYSFSKRVKPYTTIDDKSKYNNTI